MKKPDVANAGVFVEIVDRLFVRITTAKVVARRKNVARVEADADALRVIDEANDLAELLERAADARALAGRRLEQRDHFVIRQRRVDPIERSRNLFDSCARTRAHVRAWMQHDCADAEALSAIELVDHGGD